MHFLDGEYMKIKNYLKNNTTKPFTYFITVIILVFILGVGVAFVRIEGVKSIFNPVPRVYGGGTEYLFPVYPAGTLLRSYFAFSDKFFNCAVETNQEEIVMHTNEMGLVTIPPNNFFMQIESVEILNVEYSKTPEGENKSTITGIARSITRIDAFNIDFDEIVSFRADVVDGGYPGSKDSLWLTMNYNKTESPGQFAIFGHNALFGGKIFSGDIVVEL